MQLDYELRMNIRSLDQKQGSVTYGQPSDSLKQVTILKTETLDMALLPLLTKPPEHFHPVSAMKAGLSQLIDKVSVYKAGEAKPIATLFSFDTVERNKHQATDPAAEILYLVKGNFDGVSDKMKNIYLPFINEGRTSGIPLGRYAYNTQLMRHADPASFELASVMLSNIMKKGNHYDVFRWEHTPPSDGTKLAEVFIESISRIEGLVPAFTELVKNKIAPDGGYKKMDADIGLSHNFLERADNQSMIFNIHVERESTTPDQPPGIYILSPKPSIVADLVKRNPALRRIIQDAYALSPIALAVGNSLDNLKVVPEVSRLLNSENVIVSKLLTPTSKRPLFKADEIKPGLRH